MNLYLYQSFFSNKSFDDLGKSWGQVLILEFIKLLVEEFNYQEIGKSRSLFLFTRTQKRTNNNILGSMVVNFNLTNKPLYAGVVFIRYIMLAVVARRNQDPRTIGELFYSIYDEIQGITLMEALALLLELLKSTMKNFLVLSEDKVKELLIYFVNSLSARLKEKVILLNCNR
jgi:hypothetical protein